MTPASDLPTKPRSCFLLTSLRRTEITQVKSRRLSRECAWRWRDVTDDVMIARLLTLNENVFTSWIPVIISNGCFLRRNNFNFPRWVTVLCISDYGVKHILGDMTYHTISRGYGLRQIPSASLPIWMWWLHSMIFIKFKILSFQNGQTRVIHHNTNCKFMYKLDLV